MRILFVCTGNTCRSPMAEAMMRHALEIRGLDKVQVSYAGLCPMEGMPASKHAVEEMKARGLDLSRHQARRLKPEMLRGARVLCMTQAQAVALTRAFPGCEAQTINQAAGFPGDVADPYGRDRWAYNAAADQLQNAIDVIVRQYQ